MEDRCAASAIAPGKATRRLMLQPARFGSIDVLGGPTRRRADRRVGAVFLVFLYYLAISQSAGDIAADTTLGKIEKAYHVETEKSVDESEKGMERSIGQKLQSRAEQKTLKDGRQC